MTDAAPRRINLALQGGGAHGAFTWGALDRLLEDENIEIAAISGTSAGALNGAALKAGLVHGSRDVARQNLAWLWSRVSEVSDLRLNNWMSAFMPDAFAQALKYTPSVASALDWTTRMLSPYDYGYAYRNALAPIVQDMRFDKICSDSGPVFHVCATNVRSGKIRVFTGTELSPDALLASACLPTLFRAVEIPDSVTGALEAYWDGGYTGNPALYPLFEQALPDDIVVININPLHRQRLPTSTREIQNRIDEISFNSSLLRELRSIDFVQRLIADGRVAEGAMKRVLVHLIADDELMNRLSVATKTVPVRVVIDTLYEAGRAAADTFLGEHREAIGVRSSVDLREMFQ